MLVEILTLPKFKLVVLAFRMRVGAFTIVGTACTLAGLEFSAALAELAPSPKKIPLITALPPAFMVALIRTWPVMFQTR